MNKKDKNANAKQSLRYRLSLGFTLLELLIVIAILGVLATMFIATFPSATRRARDSRRQSDIRQYQTAFEKHANRNNGVYYNSGGSVDPSSAAVCSALGISSCPKDPTNTGTLVYRYNGTSSPSQYVLWARLEAVSTTNFVVCSNGKIGTTALTPTSSACPL